MRGETPDLFPDDLPEENRPIDYSPQCTSQRDRLLSALRACEVNTFYARDVLGIPHPAARIQELRQLGYKIEMIRRSAIDGSGALHYGVAHYVLISSPTPETPPQPAALPMGPGERGANDDE